MRIAVEKMPYPSSFIQFILHLFGLKEFKINDNRKFISLKEKKITNHFLIFQ
jgi:hypothetical protein